ncbi:MAG: aldo/keto reductase [Lactovum sp.]
MSITKNYTLSNGFKIPILGFGTWQSKDGEEAYQAVKVALEAGYRHIDTAAIYGNEESVGQAIRDSGILREEIYLTTKLWAVGTTKEAEKAIDESLEKLGLDYIDLYLIHWPNPKAFRPHFSERNAAVWKAMEDAVKVGKIRSIGVSNFREHHLSALLEIAKIKPVVNQIMINPSDQQEAVVDFSRAHGLLIEAYSPLGTGKIFSLIELENLAKKYNKTVAQIVLAWSLAHGYLPLPKSVTRERIIENADIFDFELETSDISYIDSLHGLAGLASNPDERNH